MGTWRGHSSGTVGGGCGMAGGGGKARGNEWLKDLRSVEISLIHTIYTRSTGAPNSHPGEIQLFPIFLGDLSSHGHLWPQAPDSMEFSSWLISLPHIPPEGLGEGAGSAWQTAQLGALPPSSPWHPPRRTAPSPSLPQLGASTPSVFHKTQERNFFLVELKNISNT